MVKRGEIAYFTLILQNALDTPVSAELTVVLPSRKMFKNTSLSTVTSAFIDLGPTEVEQVNIPIKTTLDTPEGDYEIEIYVTGSGGEGGKRVRGIKKELRKEPRVSITKSVTASVAISAIGLFFGVVGGALYVENNRIGVHMKVKGVRDSPMEGPLEIKRHKLWTQLHNEMDPKLGAYIQEAFNRYSSDSSLRDYTSTVFSKMYRDLFRSVQFDITEEENLWLSHLMTYLTFEGGGFYRFNIGLLLLNRVVELAKNNRNFREKPLQETLDFKTHVLDFWLQEIAKGDSFKRNFSYWAANALLSYMREINKLRYSENEIPHKLKEFQDRFLQSFTLYREGKDDKDFFALAVGMHLEMGVLFAHHLFGSKEETVKHLESLENIISERRYLGEGHQRRIIKRIKRALSQDF